jgi:pimeloyl-ACP methyl ester carboxylesterase
LSVTIITTLGLRTSGVFHASAGARRSPVRSGPIASSAVLAYDDEGHGPAIVFVHGIGSDRTRWMPIVEHLTDDFRCVSVDLPGHGESSDDGCDALSAASALRAVVDHLDLEQPVLVGHSLGGIVSLLYAALFDPRSVVAVDPIHLHTPSVTDSLAAYRDRLLGDDFDAAFEEWEARLRPDLVPEPQRSIVLSGFHPRADVVRSYWRVVLDREAAVASQARLSAALTAIEIPMLVLWADPPIADDAAILERMPTTTVEIRPDSGHWLHLADPVWFADRVLTWIDGLAD